MDNEMPEHIERPTQDDLAYIKYSAKELLFIQGQKLDNLNQAVQDIRLNMADKKDVDAVEKDMADMKLNVVHKAELVAARRWTTGAIIAAVAAGAAALGALGA